MIPCAAMALPGDDTIDVRNDEGFDEDRLGRLDEGYLADITVLSVDPLAADPRALLDAQVMLTIVEGELVYVRGDADAPPMVKTATTTATSTSS